VAAAAAVATIQAMREDNMLDNARERGIQLMTGLRHLQEEYPLISDVRGKGLMIGSEIRNAKREPDKAAAKNLVHACLDRGLMLLTCGPWDNTIRFMPPLVVSAEEIDSALDMFKKSLESITN
jgi:4-aminobutyrate aminotransferase